ncbi:penicillin-binding protein 2 [methane-oxidizing endosymbiont of Gigantopelta aegis]|uniref:penicillin-binding protein 2 n=1 Tax=methane-oxidizing endosymbiont of Gigantopelta aegis TaxID=2794938 RepID=UPI0018DC2212|nr:penicillin-binding protein 2 [methane-oxidizing endosymbiont of Gigantopelta aegis]
MYKRYSVKDPLQENRIFLTRVVAIFGFILLLTLGLIVRLIYLQVVGHEHYATLAKDNRIKVVPLPPTRGIIYDRKGRILAENIPSYSLELIPEQVKSLDDTLGRLQKLLNISPEDLDRFHTLRKRRKPFSSVPLLLRMSDEEVARFATVRPFFPGVDIHARLVRHYPYAELTSHVIGYVGRINEKELKSLPVAEYQGTHHVGKTGIEKYYETQLHGKTGYAEIETNAQGREVKLISAIDPVPGADLSLTLDIDLQKTAYDALESHTGAAVAIEIPSGDVLVLASRPGFDPNPFVYGISRKAYKALKQSEDQPLFDRVLRGQYPPGSTMKPFIGLAGLEYQVTDFHHKLFCPGYYKLPNVNHRYRDWKTWGHGWVDMDIAITQSCDVYFYDLAMALGIDRMHEFLSRFGFGQKTGIDLVGERSGLLPSREWKRRRKRQPWYPGETLIVGIGQGFMQATPLQLARATATLANRGQVVTPYLAKSIKTADGTAQGQQQKTTQIPLNLQNLNNIIQAMTHVVHGARGTARRLAKGIDYQIAGKTGTAQVFTVKQEEKYNAKDVHKKLRDHALFIAFAPVNDPQIAVAVVVENGGHGGSVAAPIAGKIIRQYLSERTKSHED